MPNRRYLVLYLLVAAASLWLRSAFPVFAIGGSGHDDQLYVDLAHYLAFDWLGPFSQYTLAKGMFYPLFILTTFFLGIPIKFAEHAAYLTACGLAAWLVVRLSGSRLLGFVLFAVLAFNSILWTPALARVIREGVYISLTLALIALAAAALLLREREVAGFSRRLLVVLIALGVVGADFWLTREEGIWIGPALMVLVFYAVLREWGDWRRHPSQTPLSRRIFSLAGAIAVPVAVFAVVVGSVAGINYWRYGLFTTGEFHYASFARAYGALSRIQHNEWRRYVVFPRDARARAYAVSPAARELEPYFEGPHAEGWRKMGCATMQLTRCPEIPAGWFVWAFRDAVAAAGHYRSGGEVRAYYDRLAAEIDAACDAGRIACLSSRASFMPPFRWHYVRDALTSAWKLVGLLTRGDYVGIAPSIGADAELAFFEEMVGPLARAPSHPSHFSGWIASRGVPPEISVRDTAGAPFLAKLEIRPVGGVESFEGFQAFRFELSTDCLRPTCEVVVIGGSSEYRVPIPQLSPGETPATSDVRVRIDKVVDRKDFVLSIEELRQTVPGAYAWLQPALRPAGDTVSARELRQALLVTIARTIAAAYAAVMPALAVLALIGVVLAMVRWRRFPLDPRPLGVLAIACGAAVAARVALLAYLDATSFPASSLYLSPAVAPFLMFVVLGVYLAGHFTFAALYKRKAAPPVAA